MLPHLKTSVAVISIFAILLPIYVMKYGSRYYGILYMKNATTKECNCRLTDHYSNVSMSSKYYADTRDNQLNFEDTNLSKKRLRKNVLFIIVDDMRPQIGAYFDPQQPDYFSKLRIQTPNLDKLATQSIVFKHAYAQYSLCGPIDNHMMYYL